VRVPKTIITPARYFLALSGAKPISEPMMGRDVALSMDARVRSTRAVRGQVTARRVIIVPAPTASASPSPAAASPSANRVAAPRPTPTPAVAASRPVAVGTIAAATGVPQPLIHRPGDYRPRIINGKMHVWQAIAPGSTLGRWVAERPERSRMDAQPTPSPAALGPQQPTGRTSAPRR
jgi:hypothetical protein